MAGGSGYQGSTSRGACGLDVQKAGKDLLTNKVYISLDVIDAEDKQ